MGGQAHHRGEGAALTSVRADERVFGKPRRNADSDVIYANTADMQWANFSVWLITFGLFMGVLAAVAGAVDVIAFSRQRRRRPLWHSLSTGAMMALALVNAFVHSRDAWTSVVPTGLVLSAIVAVLAVATSWQGFVIQEAR